MMSVALLRAKLLNLFALCEDFGGGKPINVNSSVGNPAPAIAAKTALGPGTGNTLTPIAAALAAKSAPGSFTVGIPASLTSASAAPLANRPSTDSLRFASLCA